jgi:tetratricopeptide (TPR) repeat protein/outer membrane protein OmpA-like peptidoglycan-associated protein
MKKFSRFLTRAVVFLLAVLISAASFAQEKKQDKPEQKSNPNAANSYSYWSIGLFGGAMQFNGDLSKNLLFNFGNKNSLGYNYGLVATKQFTRVIGVRARIAHGMLQSEADNKYVWQYSGGSGTPKLISEKFKAYVWETDLQLTVNWLNWALGYKPERLFSSYLIFGVGADQTIGHRTNVNTGADDAHIGRKSIADNMGNTSGIAGENLEFKAGAGLGFDFNINQHWSIPIEFYWRWRDGDILDMTPAGSKQVINDMYSSATVGLAYKFGYTGGSLREMEKRYSEVKYETTPPVLSEKGDSATVTIKGTFPQKYFATKAAMQFQPVLVYTGGQTELNPITLKGEKVTGDGIPIKYKEGGSFTYTTTFPYKPEMNTSMLTVAPVIYEAKEKTYSKKGEIKDKTKFIELPSRDLVPGVIYTPTRILLDQTTLVADHGYQKEVIVTKTGTVYFKKNKYDLDLKYGINKTDAAKNALSDVGNFIHQGWKIKSIDMNGWASPEGEETFNAGLSENRSKTGQKWLVDQFQAWTKEANKDNKDKKAVKAAVEAAGKDVNVPLAHHGPDWNGFLKLVQGSDLKDKDKILNVVNSAADPNKKEQEIRNMILIYPQIEEKLLPPLRRCEVTANLYEPRFTDEELSKYAVSDPSKLKVEELLYAGTLTNDPAAKLTIYDNAAKQYPNNWKALNNAASANIAKGNYAKANDYLVKAQAIAPNTGIVENNIGVVAAKQKDFKKAEAQFKKAQQLGENENYNLGIFEIPRGNYPKALNMLGNSKCSYNLGLAQLVSGNNTAAEATLKCAPQTPETFYLLSIVGARTNNSKMLYENLMKACQDTNLKAQAKGDREFYNFEKTPEFQNIVK